MEHTLSGKVPLPPIGKKPKGLFLINGWNLPFLPRFLVWLGAAQVKSTSFWPLRADPCLNSLQSQVCWSTYSVLFLT